MIFINFSTIKLPRWFVMKTFYLKLQNEKVLGFRAHKPSTKPTTERERGETVKKEEHRRKKKN